MKFKVITKYVLIALVLAVLVCCGSAAADNKFSVDTTGITQPIAYDSTTTLPVKITSTEGFAGFKVYVYNSDPAVSVQINTSLSEEEGLNGMYTFNTEGDPLVVVFAKTTDYSSGTKTAFYVDVTPSSSAKEAVLDLEVVEVKKVSGDVTSSFSAEDCTLSVQIAPSIATTVTITAPVDDTELAYGTEGTAVAVVYDQYGDVMEDEPVTWSVFKSDSTEPATGLSIDANGNYKVVNCAEGTVQIFAEYGDVSTSNVVRLVKADLESDDFTVTGLGEFVWTGQPFAVTVTAKDDGVGDISVTYNGKSDVPTAKGTYAVNISVTKGDNYNAVSNLFLGEIAITGTVIVPPTLGAFPTYTGEEQAIDLVDSANSAGMYEVSGNIGTNAGDYTVTLTLKDTVNTEWKDADSASITLDWKILPQSLAGAKITATAVSYTGGEQTPDFTVTLGDKILVAGTDYTLDAESGVAAGEYPVTVIGKGNYEGTASAKWTVSPATPTADMIDCDIPGDLVYTGEPQTLTAFAKDGIYGLGEITLQYNGTEAAVDAGTYAVTANITEGANYTAATDLTVGILIIGKATLDKDDFILSATSAEYDGEAQAVTVTTDIAGVTVSETKYNGSTTVPSAKGTYIITISATGGSNYYDVTDLEVGTFVITGRQVAEPEITGMYTYTGAELTADIEESADYKITGNKATAAGTHIVTVSLNDTANTAWKNGGIADLKLEWYIAPKSIAGAGVTPSPDTAAFTYDGIVKNPTFTVTDGTLTIAENDYIIEGDISSAVAGKHQVIIKGQNNYTGEITAEWNIAPAIPTIDNLVPTIPTGVVYGQTYEVTVAAKATVLGLGEITLLYNGTAAVPVNAGTYTVNASIAAGTNYTKAEIYLGDLVIAKATPVAANITCVMEDVVYDGKEHALTAKAADGVVGLGVITLEYNGTVAAPVAAGTYKVNASIAAGENYVAATVELGTFNITKATLTAADFTITPALPVSYEEGTAEAVVVTVNAGIFGNGTVTVKYGDVTDIEMLDAGIHKVNATFGAGTNYTAAEFYLGDMTIVKKVAPEFDINFVVNPTNITITGDYTVNADNTTTITDSSSGVVLSIKFADYETDGSKIIGNISKVNATYPEISAASPKDGEFKYGLVINLGNNLTDVLPAISSVYDEAVAGKVKPSGKTFEGLVMIGAEDVDDVNAAIKAGKGDVKLTFKIPKSAVPADKKNNIVVYHVSGDKFTKTSTSAVTEDEEFYIIVATGNGFSSYVAGIETTTPTTGGSTTGGSGGSSSKPSTTPVTPPADDPSDEPSDDPSDVPGSDIPEIPPVEPSEPGKSPAPVAGMILGALAAAAVLRRK